MVEAIKRIFSIKIILGTCAFVIIAVSAADTQNVILKAKREYEQSNWSAASALYESIEPKTSSVWYNLGNAYYQQQRCADALACWKRAQRGASSGELLDIEQNITCVLKQTGVCNANSSGHARMMCFMPSVWIVQLLFLLMWYALCLLIVLRRWIMGSYYSLICGGAAVMSGLLGILLVIQYRNCHMNSGIILNKMVNVCAGPHAQYHVLGTVHEMDEVAVYAQRPGWYKISAHNVHGWVPASTVRII